MSSAELDAPLPTFDGFRTLARIGGGGMAEVFRAVGLDEAGAPLEVAIKRIRPELAAIEQFRQMFRNEALVSAQLCHRNLVRMLGFGSDARGDDYLVFELLEGLSLSAILRRLDGPLPFRAAMGIGCAVAAGLGHLHQARDAAGQPMALVHRDVTPANIMITDEGEVKLIDFGIAKSLVRGPNMTHAGQLKGKIRYMAPEQLEGEPIDQTVDQYALGVVVFEALTGTRLFRGESDPHGDARARRPPIATLSAPVWVKDLLGKLLHPEPRGRFADMGTVVGLFQRWLPSLHHELILESLIRRCRSAAAGDTGLIAVAPDTLLDPRSPPGSRGDVYDGLPRE